MYNAKQAVLDHISSLPDDTLLGDILKEVIYLHHMEPLLKQGFVPTEEQAAVIERLCTRFNKSTLVALVKHLELDVDLSEGAYKSLLAAAILRAGYTYDDMLKIDTDLLRALETQSGG